MDESDASVLEVSINELVGYWVARYSHFFDECFLGSETSNIFLFDFQPESWGFMIQFDLCIF